METLLKIILVLNIIQNCVHAERNSRQDNEVPHFRIFQGEDARAGQFPYQVALKEELQVKHALQYTTFCGGSIIAVKKVISAAHCLTADKSFWEYIFQVPAWRKLNPSKTIYVVAGSLNNTQTIPHPQNLTFTADDMHDFNNEQWRRIRKVKVPDKYYQMKLDVAVVILKHVFFFDAYVAPIPYATKRMSYDGLKCLASGYGLISKDGDSGGPLVCFKTGEPTEGEKGILVGIACAISDGKPSMYTRFTDYVDFIDSIKFK